MKKKHVISIIVLLVFVSIVLILNKDSLIENTAKNDTTTITEQDGYYLSKYGKVKIDKWKSLDLKNSDYENVEEFLFDVDYYVDEISKYIDKSNWKEIYKDKHGEDFDFKINIIPNYVGTSHVHGCYDNFKYLILEIRLSSGSFKHNFVPIAGQITHLIAPNYSSLSLREGLSYFIQDTIGKNPAIPNYGGDVFAFSKEFITEDYKEIMEAIGNEGVPNIPLSIKYDNGTAYYTLSYSFSKYLIDEYGIEKFMEVYETKDLYPKYIEVYGKSLEDLRQMWIEYIDDYESNSKFNEYMNDLYKKIDSSDCEISKPLNSDHILEWEEKEKETVITTENAILNIEKDYLTEDEMIDIAAKIEKGIKNVKNYLGEEYCRGALSTSKIVYFIRNENFISTAGGYVSLSYVKGKQSPYIHETVHMLTESGYSRWVREGLAVYLNDYLGGYSAYPNFGIDIDELAQIFISDEFFSDVLTFDSKFSIHTSSISVEQEKRRVFYVLSGSLVKYIKNTYGKENMLDIYYTGQFEEVLGKSFEEVKNEWIDYIKNL